MPKFRNGPYRYEVDHSTAFRIVAPGGETIAAGYMDLSEAQLFAKAPPMYALLQILAEAFSESGEYPYMEKTIKDLLAEIDGE